MKIMVRSFIYLVVCLAMVMAGRAMANEGDTTDQRAKIDTSEDIEPAPNNAESETRTEAGEALSTQAEQPQPGNPTENLSAADEQAQQDVGEDDSIAAEEAAPQDAEDTSEDELTEEEVQRRLALQKKIRQYERVVDELEYEYGPYHTALEEALSDLAAAYEEAGNYNRARELYDRALHATRINAGLYSLEQAPIIKKLVNSLVKTGDVKEAIKRQRHYYWIHRQAFLREPAKMLPMLAELIEWHWQAYDQGLGEQPYEHLLNSYMLAKKQAEIIGRSAYSDTPELVRALHVMNLIDYQLYLSKVPVRESALRAYERGVPGNAVGTGGADPALSFGTASPQQTGVVSDNFLRRGRKRNQQMMRRIASEYGTDSIEFYQAALRDADWQLLYGKERTALRRYQELSYTVSLNPETQHLSDQLFGRAWRLPLRSNPLTKIDEETKGGGAPEDPQRPYMIVMYDVRADGVARNIRLLESNLVSEERAFRRTRRDLLASFFRPRMEEGRLMSSADVVETRLFSKGSYAIRGAKPESQPSGDEQLKNGKIAEEDTVAGVTEG